jgi:hypothetical protein
MNEIHFDFLNFNNILLLLVILAIGGYLYYEIHKMKLSMNDIHSKLNYLLDKREIISNDNIQSPQPDDQIIPNEAVVPNEELMPNGVMPNEVVLPNETIISSQNIKQQMDKDSEYSDSESSDDSRSESSDDSGSDSESRISQSEIEKDYGKEQFERENNNASIDDILSDKHIITDNSLSDILNVDSDLTKIDEFIQNIKSEKEETATKDMSTKDIPAKDYNDMTVSELKKVLVDMKLPVSGNKTKLVERILENKK